MLLLGCFWPALTKAELANATLTQAAHASAVDKRMLCYEPRDMKRMLFGRKSGRFLLQPPTALLSLAELMAGVVTPPTIAQEVKVIKNRQPK